MTELLKAIDTFENRNNFSITVCIHGDGSGYIKEFWEEDEFMSFQSLSDCISKLENFKAAKDENGLALSPIQLTLIDQ